MTSIKNKLLNLSKNYHGKIDWRTLYQWSMLIGCNPATANRKARELAREGKWTRLEGEYANYRYNAPSPYTVAQKITESKETNYQLNI